MSFLSSLPAMTFFSSSSTTTANKLVSVAAPVIATMMMARSFLPQDVQNVFSRAIRRMLRSFSSDITMVIHDYDGMVVNPVYEAVHTYLGNKFSSSVRRTKVTKPDAEKSFEIAIECNDDEIIVEVFNGIKFKWVFVSLKTSHNQKDISQSWELTFHKKYRNLAITSYLPFIMEQAKLMKHEVREPKIYTVDADKIYRNLNEAWKGRNLDHPATFETLALEPGIKRFILNDLDNFIRRRDYYRKIGKTWKRGYLLYGPPGTGKSSLIAAMANYLHFDIYDLELTQVRGNYELRRVMMAMTSRSILVLEDIDCASAVVSRSAPSQSQPQSKLTLSGLLNLIDGLWSSCGNERIIVFTTNHKEKLDPALLRPGRMDVHIHLSYCTPSVFRQLALNYLELVEHPLFQQIEEAILDTQVTPAEVAEEMLKVEGSDHHSTLQNLLLFLAKNKDEK